MISMLHAHKCGNCSHVWQHDTPNTKGMSEAAAEAFYDGQHMCPLCKTGPWKDKFYRNEKEREAATQAYLEQLEKLDPFDMLLLLLQTAAREEKQQVYEV